ncbi:hypothetical protein BJ138DRAFT_1106860 [Hygrophoropsis aurantiaca]|uniref:Uncharacterized protein n=1 Tax=Hygrophoropsis aurantiaca TaxID=72124 RepID=A0ACB7ZUP3_9AGAM|nr:hypothetical protein BJ138DRAFT_1106860 [Hygrophoropsis aurantiaca]
MSRSADLYREYLAPSGKELSLNQEIQLVYVENFDKTFVQDRGINDSQPQRLRFTLTIERLTLIVRLVHELQDLLRALNEELDKRHECYEIDPGNCLLPILTGASSLEHLYIGYCITMERLSTGAKFVEKYYEASKGNQYPDTPQSTESGFYDSDYMTGSPETTLRKQLLHARSPFRNEAALKNGTYPLNKKPSN